MGREKVGCCGCFLVVVVVEVVAASALFKEACSFHADEWMWGRCGLCRRCKLLVVAEVVVDATTDDLLIDDAMLAGDNNADDDGGDGSRVVIIIEDVTNAEGLAAEDAVTEQATNKVATNTTATEACQDSSKDTIVILLLFGYDMTKRMIH